MQEIDLDELETDLTVIFGIPCHWMPCDIIVAQHIKIEYLGEQDPPYAGNNKKGGTLDVNLFLRADGFNKKMVSTIRIHDLDLIKKLKTGIKLQTTNYIATLKHSKDLKPQNVGWQFPEQAIGASEPDPNDENSSSRMVYTRIFPIEINYSKIN